MATCVVKGSPHFSTSSTPWFRISHHRKILVARYSTLEAELKNSVPVHGEIKRIRSRHPKKTGVLKALWNLFSSMKTAIVLLLLLALASIYGTLIKDQGEALKRVYQSHWYVFLLVLVGLNLVVCSINRFGTGWKRTFRPEVAATPEDVGKMQRSERIRTSGDLEETASRAGAALRACSYRVISRESGSTYSLYASRGHLAVWGPYITHLSLLVIFAGAVFGSLCGFKGQTTIVENLHTEEYVPEGRTQPAPLGFRVELADFAITHDKKYNVTGYRSDLRVYDGGKVVKRKVIDVNHPLTYKGVSLFQSSYGVAGFYLAIQGQGRESKLVAFRVSTDYDTGSPVFKIASEMGEPWQVVEVGGKKMMVLVRAYVPNYVGGDEINIGSVPINPAVFVAVSDKPDDHTSLEAWTDLGWLTVSESASRGNIAVAFVDVVEYTGLSVAKNPGLPVICVGFVLLVIGVFASFYIDHRIIRVSIEGTKDGAAVVAGASSRLDPASFDKVFERLREALK